MPKKSSKKEVSVVEPVSVSAEPVQPEPIEAPVVEEPKLSVKEERFEVVQIGKRKFKRFFRDNGTTDLELL